MLCWIIRYFRYYSYSRNPTGREFFDPARTLIAVKLLKPSEEDANDAGCGRRKFFCGRKGKFGLNCQAVSDVRGRILDLSIGLAGASLDCIAFEGSDLYERLEGGLLKNGLVLYGDNADINTRYMATPFPNVSSGSKDDYNFFQS